jgi:diacylglycerol kinase (ATP)
VIADALKEGRVHDTDLGRVGDHWFATVLASGFDSRVNDRGNRMRWPAGRLKYDLAMFAELAAFRPVPSRITLDDGQVREVEATLVAVGNGSSYGGGMRICPGADLTDGLFDITVVGDCSRTTLLRVFPSVYRGTHDDHPKVSVVRAARVGIAPGRHGLRGRRAARTAAAERALCPRGGVRGGPLNCGGPVNCVKSRFRGLRSG